MHDIRASLHMKWHEPQEKTVKKTSAEYYAVLLSTT